MSTAPPAAPAVAPRRRAASRLAALTGALLALAGCSPLTALNDLFVSRDGYRLVTGLAYGPAPRQTLDIYIPERLTAPAKVVVFFYGGAWRGGDRGYYRFLGQALSREGLIVVIPDYRVYPEVQFPAFVADGGRALAWVAARIAEFGGNPDDVWLMGHSAGAHIAALLITDDRYLGAEGLDRRRIQGFIGLAGPYAIEPLRYRTIRPVFAGIEAPDAARPIDQVDGGEPPMLLLHGSDDGTVWPVQSHAFAERVNAAGGRATVIEYPGKGHVGLILALSEAFRGPGDVYRDVIRFLAPPAADPVPDGDAARVALQRPPK